MAPRVIPPNFAEITAHYTDKSGHACVNVFGVGFVADVDQDVIDAWSTQVSGDYKSMLSDDSTYTGAKIVANVGGDLKALESAEGAGPGNNSNESLLTPQVQYLIKKSTAGFGRAFTGRTFIGDVIASQTDDVGTNDSTAMARLQAFADGIMAACNAVANPPFVGMYLLHPEGIDPTEVTAYIPQIKVATLRGRYPR